MFIFYIYLVVGGQNTISFGGPWLPLDPPMVMYIVHTYAADAFSCYCC